MEVPWGDFILTPPSFASASQTGYSPEYDAVAPPPQDFSSVFTSLPSDPPTEILDGKPLTAPAQASVLDLNEIENRALLITNVHPETSESEIQELLNPFNDIRTISISLESGTIVVEYFDLRRANHIRRNCNNVVLHDNVICVAYAPLPKIDDPRKPPNNGTIVVFHLPTGITNPQIDSSFGEFGEIRQVRGTPSKPNQKFIEYWDIRDAQKALDALNGQYVMGSRVSIEFSLPGGFRRSVQRG
jgi:RNA recognition motif-containing protein